MTESIEPHPASSPAAPMPAWEGLHPNARRAMRLFTAIGASLVAIPPTVILLVLWDSAGLPIGAKLALFVACVLLLASAGWLFGAARWRRTAFALDDAGLRLQRGVIWRSETFVPRSRVQHTDINRGPLDRRLGLSTLKVYTAGTKLASVSIDGLPEARAEQLRDALVNHDDDAL